MSGRVVGPRKRDWARAQVRVLGPSREGGTYRAALHGRMSGVCGQWWQCTGHKPHPTRDEAIACALDALGRFQAGTVTAP